MLIKRPILFCKDGIPFALYQFKAIEKMPERDKDVVKTLIDALITKGKLKQLVL